MKDIKIPLFAISIIVSGAARRAGARIVWADESGWYLGGFYKTGGVQ
jgi:hypothetical protein